MATTLSPEQKQILTDLCRQVSISPMHIDSALQYCEEIYRKGVDTGREPISNIKTVEDQQQRLEDLVPLAFRVAVDELSDPSKKIRRQAATIIKKELKKLKFH